MFCPSPHLALTGISFEEWSNLVSIVIPVYAAMALGAMARRLNWLTHEADESILKMLLRIMLPCFIFDALVGNPRVMAISDMWLPPVVGFGLLALGYVMSVIIAGLLRKPFGLKDARMRRTFNFTVGTFNWGYIPIPLVLMKFDTETLGVLIVHNLGIEVGLWTIGLMVLSGGMGSGWIKRIINPPLVSILVALGINLLGFHEKVPEFITGTAAMIGPCAVPVGLILVGAIIADHFDKKSLQTGIDTTIASCVMRLGVIPAAFFAIAMFVPMPSDLTRVVAIQAAMPAAAFPIVLSKHYDGDTPTALRVVLGTSIVSLVSIPLVLAIGYELKLL